MSKRNLILCFVVSLFCFITAGRSYAAETAAWTIDPSKLCTLTVHAYIDQENCPRGDIPPENQAVPSSAYPLEGAVYSLWKVGDVSQLVVDGTLGVYIHNVSGEFSDLIGDRPGISVKGTDTGAETYYSAADMQSALDALLKDPAALLTGEDALNQLVLKYGTAMAPTGQDGISQVSDLPQGLYVLARTGFTSDVCTPIISGQSPAFIMLPQMNVSKFSDDTQTYETAPVWLYESDVYPKNQTAVSGKKILPGGSLGSAADSGDFETGTTLSFVSYVNIPCQEETSGYDVISMKDKMTGGLSFVRVTKVLCGPWLPAENLSADALAGYAELFPDTEYTVTGDTDTFALELTSAGYDKINSLRANSGIYVFYDALLGPSSAIGTEGENANESSWTLSTVKTAQNYELKPAKVCVHTYGIELLKNGLSDAQKARFEVRRGQDILYFKQMSAGSYILWNTEDGELVSSLSPGPGGTLKIFGLGPDAYTFTETKTEDGKNLLASPFTITLTPSPTEDGSLAGAELRMDGMAPLELEISDDNAGIAQISVSNEGVITPLKTGDDGYFEVAAFAVVFGLLLLAVLLVRWKRGR